MTAAQVVETPVTVTNSSFQNYIQPDMDRTRQTTVLARSFVEISKTFDVHQI